MASAASGDPMLAGVVVSFGAAQHGPGAMAMATPSLEGATEVPHTATVFLQASPCDGKLVLGHKVTGEIAHVSGDNAIFFGKVALLISMVRPQEPLHANMGHVVMEISWEAWLPLLLLISHMPDGRRFRLCVGVCVKPHVVTMARREGVHVGIAW